jgi:uncharacterized protein
MAERSPHIDLRALDLRPGDVHREQVPVSFEPLRLGGQSYEARPARVRAALEVQAASGGTYLKLAFATSVCGPCYRCLEEACAPVRVQTTEYGGSGADADEQLASDYLEDRSLDVGRWAHEALVLALPPKLLCSPDCAGLCSRCGERLQAGVEHACGEPELDPRWAKLQDLF